MAPLLFFVALFTVTHCRVTFTNSEVLQQSDLDGAKKAKFKCDNGCMIYSDSQSPDMYINDGSRDVQSFLAMGPPDKPIRTELAASNKYTIVFRGAGTPPRFVFYAVDKKSPNLDTIVYAVNAEHGYSASVSGGPRRFTVLTSDDTAPFITFSGDFAAGFPRIYATGFDAASEDACSPVYQARSQESATKSFISVPSPILTVDKGASNAKSNLIQKTSESFTHKNGNSSLIYMSPGYVGCEYNKNQMYAVGTNTVLDTFSSDVESLDIDASLSISNANDAVHITVNNEPFGLFGNTPIRRHFDADRFDVTISWIRNAPDSNFALQIDLGIPQKLIDDSTRTTKSSGNAELSTTSQTAFVSITLSSLLAVVYAAWMR